MDLSLTKKRRIKHIYREFVFTTIIDLSNRAVAPDTDALVQLHIECARILQKRGWSFISAVYSLVDHLVVMKRKYFILERRVKFVYKPWCMIMTKH